MASYHLVINARRHAVRTLPDVPLLWILRDSLGLTGAKYGCGIGARGACSVHLDGAAVRSCTLPVDNVDDRAVTTIEGLSSDGSHRVQRARVSEDVPQCGYCQGGFRLDRVVAAVDCGRVVNRSGAVAQIEGGVLEGLSAALYGQVSVESGRPIQTNFDSYRLLRFDEAPRVEVHFVPSEAPPTGLGEPGVPPAAPALANAIFGLTGERIRRLPISSRPA